MLLLLLLLVVVVPGGGGGQEGGREVVAFASVTGGGGKEGTHHAPSRNSPDLAFCSPIGCDFFPQFVAFCRIFDPSFVKDEHWMYALLQHTIHTHK